MNSFKRRWSKFWLNLPRWPLIKNIFLKLAVLGVPPHYKRDILCLYSKKGYISPKAQIHHSNFTYEQNVFLADDSIIFQADRGGRIKLGKKVKIFQGAILQTGEGGEIEISDFCVIHPGAVISAVVGSIKIGEHSQVGINAALYSYNHSFSPDELIYTQPIVSKGDIIVGSDVMIGHGGIILDGVTLGDGVVVGAGSVVMQSFPKNAIVSGFPARNFGNRDLIKD